MSSGGVIVWPSGFEQAFQPIETAGPALVVLAGQIGVGEELMGQDDLGGAPSIEELDRNRGLIVVVAGLLPTPGVDQTVGSIDLRATIPRV
jgi:hypothetical protein